MKPIEDIDPHFLHALIKVAGVETGEFAFERRGSGSTTYPLHGVILAVNTQTGTITLRRTRTHAGEVHEMGLRYFLSATTPQGQRWENAGLVERNRQYQAKQQARENAIASALASTTLRRRVRPTRSALVGAVDLTLHGRRVIGYRYMDREYPELKVVITASSLPAAQQFMGMQDLFMTLDDTIWDAINGHVLWPAGIECDRAKNPEAWSTDWMPIYDVLQGLLPSTLQLYLDAIRSDYEFPRLTKFSKADLQALEARGLIRYQPTPSTSREVLEKVPSIIALRQLMKDHGITARAMSRALLIDQMLSHETPALIEAAKRLNPPPRARFLAPCGLSTQEFRGCIGELRNSIFLMRQWLRGFEDRIQKHEEVILRAAS